MDAARLSDAIEVSPGFNTAVTVESDLNNSHKVRAYIPTNAAVDVLADLEKHLHPMFEGPRSRVITGTYGTGKSHLALTIARLYRGGMNDEDLEPVFRKLEGKWPGRAQKISEGRTRVPGFFLVLLEGDEGHFEDALLSRLSGALRRAGLEDLLPETAFKAAVARIEDLRVNFPATYELMQQRISDFGEPSLSALEKRLENSEKAAFSKFCDLYREVLAGADFVTSFGMKPKDVYSAVAKRLIKDHGYAGIAVMWDEFGRYMERVVDDPRGLDGDAIQKFAEGCNHSKGQIHLYLVCHRSLQEYVKLGSVSRAMGMSQRDEQEWTKICGRFSEFRMQSTDHEVFDLIDQVVIQKVDTPAFRSLMSSSAAALEGCTDEASQVSLFPEFGRDDVHSVVTVGAFPLHPMAAFLLPKVSQEVAQSERTLFTFLSDGGPGTLGPFLEMTELAEGCDWPPFFPADSLWDYFSQDVADHPMHKRLHARYEKAAGQVPADAGLQKRILKSVALLSVAGSDRAPATAETIRMTLALPASRMDEIQQHLDDLSSARGEQELILVRNVADKAYRFPTVGAGAGLSESTIEEVVAERFTRVVPAAHLRSILAELPISSEQLPTDSIPATSYNDDFMTIERGLKVEFIDPHDAVHPDRWLDNLGAGEFIDGYALIVLCEDSDSLAVANEAATSSLSHEQLLVGIPEEPILLGRLLRRHEAMRHLAMSQKHLYGEGAPFREEWEQQDRDYVDAITKVVEPLVDPENERLDWYVGGERQENVVTVGRLRAVASDMMRAVFPKTPHIVHDRLTSEEGRDSQSTVRKEVMNDLLAPDGPKHLATETGKKNKTAIDAVFVRTGILQKHGSTWVLAQPAYEREPGAHDAWAAVDSCVTEAMEHSIPMRQVVDTLRRPPFGMRVRSIPLVVAAVFRKYIDFGNLSIIAASGKPAERIDGKTLDDALLWPAGYTLAYREVGAKQMAVRDGIAAAFELFPSEAEDGDGFIKRIREAVAYWWRGLPYFAHMTTAVSDATVQIRRHVFARLADEDADAPTDVPHFSLTI